MVPGGEYPERAIDRNVRTYTRLSGVKLDVSKVAAPSYTMGTVRPAAMPSRKLAVLYAEKQQKERHALATGSMCLNDARKSARPRHLKDVVTLALT